MWPCRIRPLTVTRCLPRLFAFFHLAAYTGARRGELLNLHWADIDLDGKQVAITGSTAVIGGQRIDGTTKSGRTRTIGIDEETVMVLKEHQQAQADEQGAWVRLGVATSAGMSSHRAGATRCTRTP